MGRKLLLCFPFQLRSHRLEPYIGAHADQGDVGQSFPKDILGGPFWHSSLLY